MVGLDGDGGHVALGGPKQRALLAMLVLDGNAVVSRDRLIEGLWGERPPSDVEHALDVQVSALRRALAAGEAGRLVRRSPGYVLTVRAGEFDLDEFESLATEGRRLRADGHDHAAAEILGRALNLWRGPALSDVMSVPFAAEAARRLEERRLGAVEDRVDAQLATGDAPELCSELEALVAEHPFRERLIASLAVALYRAGRQAAALETIAAARRRFAEELGLQPGPALREVEAQILRDDPALLARPRRVGMSASVRTRRPPLRAVVAAVAALSLVIAGGAAVLHLARSDAARPALADVTGVGALALSSGDTLAAAQLPGAPAAIAADASGAWIADPDDNVVARVDPATGAVTARLTVAG